MMKKAAFLLIAILGVFALANGLNTVRATDFPLGTTIEDFKLKDTNGDEKKFNDLKGDKGAVIIFLSAQCPVVKGYNARIKKIAEDYKDSGIKFIGMNSNATESLEWVKSHAAENYPFTMLIDTNNVIADKLVASATPEVFFFDENNKLIYHGAIDNDRSGDNVTANYLRDALDQKIAGQAIAKTETKAFGCTIKRKE